MVSQALLKSVGRSEAGLGVRVPPPPLNIRIKCSYHCYDPSSTLGNRFTGLGVAYRSPSVYISRINYKVRVKGVVGKSWSKVFHELTWQNLFSNKQMRKGTHLVILLWCAKTIRQRTFNKDKRIPPLKFRFLINSYKSNFIFGGLPKLVKGPHC